MLFSLFFVTAASDPLVAARLRGFDNDMSPRTLSALVADPVGALLEVVDDRAQPVFVRARALSLLGHYLESRTFTALLRMARHEEPELRIKALKGLRYVAEKMPAAGEDPMLVAALNDGLVDRDRFVRMQAVRACTAVPAQHSALQRARESERDAGVRRTFDEVLR